MLDKREISIFVIRWLHGKTGKFDFLNDISDYVKLIQMIETSDDVNHDASIIRCWIYDYNDKRALPLIK